jgi:endonuclease YncB( thermonuclease family)
MHPRKYRISLPLLTAAFIGLPGMASAMPMVDVAKVLDGDTVEVLDRTRTMRIRLHGIDCPEKGQPFGGQARHATADLTLGTRIGLDVFGTDRYGRTIADLRREDGTLINRELVREGWCWWYRRYAPTDVELAALEAEARQHRRGLWADAHPIAPWEWRTRTRRRSREEAVNDDNQRAVLAPAPPISSPR